MRTQFPDPTPPSKVLIGQPGHDTNSAWARFDKAYRNPCSYYLNGKYPHDKDHVDDAIQKMFLRIHREHGLRFDHDTTPLRAVLLKRLNEEMYDDRTSRMKKLAHENNFLANESVLLQATRTDRGSPLQDRIGEAALAVNREIFTGLYKTQPYADRLDNRDVLIWKYLLMGLKGVTIIGLVGRSCSSSTVTRIKQEFPATILEIAKERVKQQM